MALVYHNFQRKGITVWHVLALRAARPPFLPRLKAWASWQVSCDAAAISPDGRTVYVATGHGIWAVATAPLDVRATYLVGQRISSVALSRDGSRLYALGADHSLVALGVARGDVPGNAAQSGAWAIEQVTSKS